MAGASATRLSGESTGHDDGMEEHEDVRRAGREVVGAKADVLPMTTAAAATLMISSDRTMMCRYSFDGGPSVTRSVWLYWIDQRRCEKWAVSGAGDLSSHRAFSQDRITSGPTTRCTCGENMRQ